jgi:hypothetical protein
MPRGRDQRRRVLLLCLALVAGSLATATMAAAQTADATTSAKVKPVGIALRYPTDWTAVPVSKKALTAELKAVENDPKLVAALKALSAAAIGNHVDFEAIDRTQPDADGFVAVQSAPGPFPANLGVFTVAAAAQYKKQGMEVHTSETKVSGKRAYRVDAIEHTQNSDGTPHSVRYAQLVIDAGSTMTVVTVTADDNAVGAQQLEAILSSLRRV